MLVYFLGLPIIFGIDFLIYIGLNWYLGDDDE